MGILSDNINKPVNPKNLKTTGFVMQGWGRPDDRTKRTVSTKWKAGHHFWEYFDDSDSIYNIVVWYFPKGFTGYVTPFNWHGKSAECNAYITLDTKVGTTSDWHEIMEVNSMLDIDAAIAIAKTRIKELRK